MTTTFMDFNLISKSQRLRSDPKMLEIRNLKNSMRSRDDVYINQKGSHMNFIIAIYLFPAVTDAPPASDSINTCSFSMEQIASKMTRYHDLYILTMPLTRFCRIIQIPDHPPRLYRSPSERLIFPRKKSLKYLLFDTVISSNYHTFHQSPSNWRNIPVFIKTCNHSSLIQSY